MNYDIAVKEFEKYLDDYDRNNGSIKLKIIHTYEVVHKCSMLAKSLNLSKENIELAKIIGLLHDIGRFEQIKNFGEFNDKLLEHAKYGVIYLFDNNNIRRFISDSKYDSIIYKAIINHNKLGIEDNLNENELLFAKIIRDADKLDNFRVKLVDKIEYMFPKIYNKDTIDYEVISDKVYNDFMMHECIALNDRKTIIDYWLCVIAFIYDLNFTVSLKYVKDNDYVNKLIDRLDYKNIETKEKIKNIRKCMIEYVNSKCNI